MTDLTKIYIDLSKCTDEQQKHIFSLLPDSPQDISSPPIIFGNICLIFTDKWTVINKKSFWGRTEITYPEFIKLFEGVREKSVEEILSDIDYWSTKYEFNFQFWGDSNNNLFITKGGVRMYDNGGLETPKEAILDALKYISRVNPLNSNPKT